MKENGDIPDTRTTDAVRLQKREKETIINNRI